MTIYWYLCDDKYEVAVAMPHDPKPWRANELAQQYLKSIRGYKNITLLKTHFNPGIDGPMILNTTQIFENGINYNILVERALSTEH